MASKVHKSYIALGSPDGVSQLASKVHKHPFLCHVSLAFICDGDWFLSTDFSNMAYFVAIVTTLVLIGAIFSIMVGCFVSTACAWLVQSVDSMLLSSLESF